MFYCENFVKLSENYCKSKTKVLQLKHLKKTAMCVVFVRIRREICERNPIFHWLGI